MPSFTVPTTVPGTSIPIPGVGGDQVSIGGGNGPVSVQPPQPQATDQPSTDQTATPPTPAWANVTVPDGIAVQSADPDAGKKAATALQALGSGFTIVSVSDNAAAAGQPATYNVIVKNANGDLGAMLVGSNAEIIQAPTQSDGKPLNTPSTGTTAANTTANATAKKDQAAVQKVYSSGGNMYTTDPNTGQPVYIGPDNSALAKAQGPHAVGGRMFQWQEGQPNADGTTGSGTWVDTGPVQATPTEQAQIQNAQDQLKLTAQKNAVDAAQNQQKLNQNQQALNKPSVVGGGTAADRYITSIGPDASGNYQITNTPNANYTPPKPEVQPGFENSAKVPVMTYDPDAQKWTMTWQDNQGRPMTNANLWDFFGQLKGVVGNGDGQIPLDEAKAYATAAYQAFDAQTQRMNAQTSQQTQQTNALTAESNALDNQQKNALSGAQTGAGLLQNRVQAGTGMVNNTLNQVWGNKNFGLGSKLPSGWGQQLLQGAQDFTTGLGGGPEVYTAAANLVKNANPQLANGPNGPQVQAQLADMLAKYKQMTGQDHPLVSGQQPNQQPDQTQPPTAAPPAPTPPPAPPSPLAAGFTPAVPGVAPITPVTAPGGAAITPNFNMTNF